jgi:predicted RNase H-like HicB family nuclease
MLEWDAQDKLWVTYVPALDFLSTYGETKETALAHTREAIVGYLEASAKEGLPVPSGATEAELVCIDIPVA